jgi:hypothetical protein
MKESNEREAYHLMAENGGEMAGIVSACNQCQPSALFNENKCLAESCGINNVSIENKRTGSGWPGLYFCQLNVSLSCAKLWQQLNM